MTKAELKDFLLSETKNAKDALNALEDGELLSTLGVSQEDAEDLHEELQKEVRSIMKTQELIPVGEVPQHLPVGLPTIRAWVMQQKVPVVRIGRRVFFKREVIDRILREGTEELFAEMRKLKEKNGN